jgi:hypothetical protein
LLQEIGVASGDAVDLKVNKKGRLVMSPIRTEPRAAGRKTASAGAIGETGRAGWIAAANGEPRRRLAGALGDNGEPQPCVVLSPPEIHDYLSLVTVAPLSATARPRPIGCRSTPQKRAASFTSNKSERSRSGF